MSYPTKTTFVYQGPWSEATRAHPATKWFEGYVRNIIDARAWSTPFADGHASDFTFVKSDGTVNPSGEASWAALQEVYAVFTANRHAPKQLACWETDFGWEMLGSAIIYGNLVGEPASGAAKVKDEEGAEWDVATPGSFRFQFVKQGNDVRLKRSEIFADSLPAATILMARGVIKPGQ